MRQDIRFKPGECVTSRHYAAWLSHAVDYLITVDPHLHRYESLDEIYSIPNRVVPAAPLVAQWIQTQVTAPLLLGPDSESEQWVSHVAELAGAPYEILEKTRNGDRDVLISKPKLQDFRNHTPVLMDDIISSGHTMLGTVQHILDAGLPAPVCIGIHGLFADPITYRELQHTTSRLVSSNTVPHETNAINVGPALVPALSEWLRGDS